MNENWIQKLSNYDFIFDNILNNGTLSTVYNGIKYIGMIIIIALAIKAIIESLSSGGTKPIDSTKDIMIPILYIVVLVFWLDILSILDTLTKYISNTISLAIESGNLDGETKFKVLTEKLLNKVKSKSVVDKGMELARGNFSSLTMPLEIWFLDTLRSFGLFLENISLTFFYGYSRTILTLLKMTGIIAVVLSFTGKMNSFMVWIKNFISVQLWLVIAYMVFYIVDQLYITFADFDSVVIENISGSGSLALRHLWYFIGFGILKLVLMFKVPQIVSMFIGSSGGGGGMFGVMFAPVKIGMDGVKAAVSGGKSLAGKFKK